MRPLETGFSFVSSVTLHVFMGLPLLALSWLTAPEVDEDEDDVEVYAEGGAANERGLLVDDAVLTVTVLNTEMDWKATEVTPDPTAAPPTPTPAEKPKQAKKDAEPTPDGTKSDKDDGGGADAADPSTGTNQPSPQAQKSSGKNSKPCAVNPDIARLETWKWGVERDLIELYAKDTKKLNRLARVTAHDTKDGKPDGFKLGLPHCSVLKQAGLKTGDVVKDVNGRKIHNLFQAVGAYFTLRKERDFVLHVERKGSLITLRYRVDHGAARNAKPMAEPAAP